GQQGSERGAHRGSYRYRREHHRCGLSLLQHHAQRRREALQQGRQRGGEGCSGADRRGRGSVIQLSQRTLRSVSIRCESQFFSSSSFSSAETSSRNNSMPTVLSCATGSVMHSVLLYLTPVPWS